MGTISTEPRKTDRLTLRLPRMEDAEALFEAYATDALVTKYLVWRPHASVEVTRGFLADRLEDWRLERERAWILEEAATRVPIGMISLRCEDAFKGTMGYVLARPHWGRGLMTEAVRTVIRIALDEQRLFRVAAFCDVENVGSARVMEKAGMTKEGRVRRYLLHPNVSSEPRDAWLYASTR